MKSIFSLPITHSPITHHSSLERSRHDDMRDTRLHELATFHGEPVLCVEARCVGLGMQPYYLMS